VSHSQSQTDSLTSNKQDTTVLADTSRVEKVDSLAILKKDFETFEYGNAIIHSNNLLVHRERLNSQQLIEVYLIKAISHFTLAEDQAAERSFTEILKIDSSFTPDSVKTSPKIITFFNNIKESYKQKLLERETQTVIRTDTVYIMQEIPAEILESRIKKTFFLSLIFPGLGHIYNNYLAKGWILTTLGAASLGSMIYFIIDSNKKEDLYFKEINSSLIQEKYDEYNYSFKMRNASIIAFAALWIYSQFDLIFISESNKDLTVLPEIKLHPLHGLTLNLWYNF
jgi:hypothetical protein